MKAGKILKSIFNVKTMTLGRTKTDAVVLGSLLLPRSTDSQMLEDPE